MYRNRHILKIRDNFADEVYRGSKNFEVRLNDRGYQKGDYVSFRAVDENDIVCRHPINNCFYEITYVLNGWGIKEGYVAFGIKQVSKREVDL